MTKDEALKLVGIMASAYPRFYKAEDKVGMDRLASIFAQTVQGTYQEAQTALRAYITLDVTGFPPVPGNINEFIGEGIMTAAEAWDLVTKAIRNAAYHSEEEFAKLPPIVQRAVGGASVLREWAQTDLTSIQTVVASNFKRAYDIELKREKESLVVPGRQLPPPAEAPQIEQKEEPEPEYRDRTKDIEELKKRLGLA